MGKDIHAITRDKMESFKVKTKIKDILSASEDLEVLGMVGNETYVWDGKYALRVSVNRMLGWDGRSWGGRNWLTRKQAIAEIEQAQKDAIRHLERLEEDLALLKASLTGE